MVLIVVKFGGCLVITHDHGSFEGRHQVEILPTGLPEPFKPARVLLEPRKFQILGPNISKKNERFGGFLKPPGHFQPVLGRKFCVESEFGVKNLGSRRPGAKNYENQRQDVFFRESFPI